MASSGFWNQVESEIRRRDLLTHPFYQAWSAGQLSRYDLARYAAEYYHHIAAFPTYLSALHARLHPGPLRQAVLQNLYEEENVGRSHSELWLDFADGVGASRDQIRFQRPILSIVELIAVFRYLASLAPIPKVLGALYAYESEVPRIAQTKARGLVDLYDADERTTAYFTLHIRVDTTHAAVWREQLLSVVKQDDAAAGEAIEGVKQATAALWRALDGIEESQHTKSGLKPN